MPRRRPHLLSHLVADAAERNPDAPAVVDGDERLDHGELADRVARTAAALRARGVGADDRVMVFAPKSADSFVAMHAALHAGAIAVPVNPQAPAAHVEAVIGEVAPAAVVVHPATVDRLPAGSPLLVGDAADRSGALTWQEIAATDPVGPAPRTGHDPAYLITTSGSTGRPKAIVHTHASGLRYAELAADCYGLGPDDRMANVAPFHFDQSTFELYAAPLVGAAVVLVSEVLVRFPASVSELVEREAVTTWYSVPTILRQLLERGALETRDLSALRWVLFGGEVFPAPVLARLMAQAPGARFSNVYGPAEVNQCTHHHLTGPPGDDDPVPIGRAWDDTELRLVDGDRVVEGPGRGELLVRTSTAMAGYWNRPDLDEAAFVTEPGPGGLPRRWYRTGDVVERAADGTLVFAGRRDRQVKVRGIRLELEAVEAAMTGVEGVTASAAIVVEDPERPLVGLVESSTLDDATPVRQALAAVLPPGTSPDRILVVPALPRTGSGKVDVNAAAALIEAEVTA